MNVSSKMYSNMITCSCNNFPYYNRIISYLLLTCVTLFGNITNFIHKHIYYDLYHVYSVLSPTCGG